MQPGSAYEVSHTKVAGHTKQPSSDSIQLEIETPLILWLLCKMGYELLLPRLSCMPPTKQ